MFSTFLTFFLPLFVSIDAIGLLPVFLTVTRGLNHHDRRKSAIEAVIAAAIISVIFMLVGEWIFRFLNITDSDFKIAGGIILLVMAVIDILVPGKPAVNEREMTGIVPLAMPLIVGPATLATLLILAKRPEGYILTSLSLAINFVILLVVLLAADVVARFVGVGVLKALSKMVMVLLAAIGVNYILTGLKQGLVLH
jgi:multiple antibiotic resistance protein